MTHFQQQHGIGRGESTPHLPQRGVGGGGGIFRDRTPAQYIVSFPSIIAWLRWLLQEYQGTVSSRTNRRVKISHQRSQYSILILEEGNQPHLWFPKCDMFVPQEALNQAQKNPEMCRHRTERKQWRIFVEDIEEWMVGVFSEYVTQLIPVTYFNYLVQMLLSFNNNWLEIEYNLQRAWGKWGRLENILVREGAGRRTTGEFYVAVVQAVLLFGTNMWVLTPPLDKYFEGFHHRAVRQISGMVPKSQLDGTWVYALFHPKTSTFLHTLSF